MNGWRVITRHDGEPIVEFPDGWLHIDAPAGVTNHARRVQIAEMIASAGNQSESAG